jgi:hypothetical protein
MVPGGQQVLTKAVGALSGCEHRARVQAGMDRDQAALGSGSLPQSGQGLPEWVHKISTSCTGRTHATGLASAHDGGDSNLRLILNGCSGVAQHQCFVLLTFCSCV